MFLGKNKKTPDVDLVGDDQGREAKVVSPAGSQQAVAVRSPRTSETDRLEKEWLRRIHEKLMSVIDLSQVVNMPERAARTQIREITQRLVDEEQIPLAAASRVRIVKGVEDEIESESEKPAPAALPKAETAPPAKQIAPAGDQSTEA